jgi:hypothetical protein
MFARDGQGRVCIEPANKGTTATGRAEEHRKRIAGELGTIGDQRLECEKEKLFAYLKEEE